MISMSVSGAVSVPLQGNAEFGELHREWTLAHVHREEWHSSHHRSPCSEHGVPCVIHWQEEHFLRPFFCRLLVKFKKREKNKLDPVTFYTNYTDERNFLIFIFAAFCYPADCLYLLYCSQKKQTKKTKMQLCLFCTILSVLLPIHGRLQTVMSQNIGWALFARSSPLVTD